MNYSEISLHEKLQQGIADAGYVTCTPVQEQVLSLALDGSDLYVQSQTGTGKTAAFLVTIFQELLTNPEKQGCKALIMVPTRELAVQVEDEAKKLGKYTGLVCESFYGEAEVFVITAEGGVGEIAQGVRSPAENRPLGPWPWRAPLPWC